MLLCLADPNYKVPVVRHLDGNSSAAARQEDAPEGVNLLQEGAAFKTELEALKKKRRIVCNSYLMELCILIVIALRCDAPAQSFSQRNLE